MLRVKTAPSRQVVIPKKFWDQLHLKPGDILDVELDETNNSLIYTPKEVVNKIEVERKNWIKGLIDAAKKDPIDIEENLVLDSEIKENLFKEHYGNFKKKS